MKIVTAYILEMLSSFNRKVSGGELMKILTAYCLELEETVSMALSN